MCGERGRSKFRDRLCNCGYAFSKRTVHCRPNDKQGRAHSVPTSAAWKRPCGIQWSRLLLSIQQLYNLKAGIPSVLTKVNLRTPVEIIATISAHGVVVNQAMTRLRSLSD